MVLGMGMGEAWQFKALWRHCTKFLTFKTKVVRKLILIIPSQPNLNTGTGTYWFAYLKNTVVILYHGGQNIFSHGLVLKRTFREQCHERKKIEGGTKKICRSVPLARTNATTRMLQSRTDVTLSIFQISWLGTVSAVFWNLYLFALNASGYESTSNKDADFFWPLPKIKKMLQLLNTNSWLEKQEYLSLML